MGAGGKRVGPIVGKARPTSLCPVLKCCPMCMVDRVRKGS